MSKEVTKVIKCDKCGRVKEEMDCHWAYIEYNSSYYAYDDGDIPEYHRYDLCPGCKKLLDGFMKNMEYDDIYLNQLLMVKPDMERKVSPIRRTFEL